jgi:Tol biopolymer transport system component
MSFRYALLALAALALPACEEDINDDSATPAVTRRVSVDVAGTEANRESERPDVTPDGRYVVFESAAGSLVPGDTNGKIDIFRKDLVSGAIVLVSVNDLGQAGDGDSTNPSISADGTRVAFESRALNLSGGTDVDDLPDIYVRDLEAGTTVHVSQAEGGGPPLVGDGSFSPSISGDGRYVVFASDAEDIVSAPFNPGDTQVYRYDLEAPEVIMVSLSTSGEAGAGTSSVPSVSFDGRYVAFESTAQDLVANDAAPTDVFVRDMQAEATERISVEHPSNPDSLADGDNANGASQAPRITPDGRFVVFASDAPDLVEGDSNSQFDVFLFDRQVPTSMTKVSVSIGGGGGSRASSNPSVSPDGRFVAFLSEASNLVAGDLNDALDHFLRDVALGTTYRVSVRTGGAETSGSSTGRPALTADGRFVLFASQGPNLVVGDTNGLADIFIRGPHY